MVLKIHTNRAPFPRVTYENNQKDSTFEDIVVLYNFTKQNSKHHTKYLQAYNSTQPWLLPSYLSMKGISLRSPFVHLLLGQSISHIPLSPVSAEVQMRMQRRAALSAILIDYGTLLRLTPWNWGSRKPMHITLHAISLYQRVPK